MPCPFLTGQMTAGMANPHLAGFPDLKDDPMLPPDAHYVTPGQPDLDRVRPGDWVDILGNGLLRKKVLTVGLGKSTMPREGDKIAVHCVGTLKKDGATFMDTRKDGAPLSFWLGEGEVPWGWDIALPLWQEGEVAVLESDQTYGYGDAGLPPHVPPKAWVNFEIELVSVERRPNFGDMPAAERIAYAKSKRALGKKQFGTGDIDAAATSFSAADAMFQRASAVVLRNRLEELRKNKEKKGEGDTGSTDESTRMAATLGSAFPALAGDLNSLMSDKSPLGADACGSGGLLTQADRRVWISCLNWLTRVRLDMKMKDAAQDASSRAMLLDPKNPKTLAQAAWLLIALGDNVSAGVQALRALDADAECAPAKKVLEELEVTSAADVKDARREHKRMVAQELREAKAEEKEAESGGVSGKLLLIAVLLALLAALMASVMNGVSPVGTAGGPRARSNQKFMA